MGFPQSDWMTGGCLCGAVRFSAKPVEHKFGVCHCGMCRKWTAGAFMAVNCGADVKVEDEGALGTYRSSDWGERCFCRACGTILFWRLQSLEQIMVSRDAFDSPDGFVFDSEIFIDEKPAAYEFANDTKKMTGAEVYAAVMAEQEARDG